MRNPSEEEQLYAMTLGALLRAHRELREETQEHVALNVIGCSQSRLSRIESGTLQPSAFQLRALAKYIGMPVDKLNERVHSVQEFAHTIFDAASRRRRRPWAPEVASEVYAMALSISVAASDP